MLYPQLMMDPRKVLMNSFTSREHLQKVLPENDILCAELSDIGFLRVHHLQLYIYTRKFFTKERIRKGRKNDSSVFSRYRRTDLGNFFVRVLSELERPLLARR